MIKNETENENGDIETTYSSSIDYEVNVNAVSTDVISLTDGLSFGSIDLKWQNDTRSFWINSSLILAKNKCSTLSANISHAMNRISITQQDNNQRRENIAWDALTASYAGNQLIPAWPNGSDESAERVGVMSIIDRDTDQILSRFINVAEDAIGRHTLMKRMSLLTG